MLKDRSLPLLTFSWFYILTALSMAGIIVYGIVFTDNRDTVWLLMLVLSLFLAVANVGILFYQNWARRMHVALAGIFSAIMIPAILKFAAGLYACAGECEPVDSTAGEITALAVAGLLLVMLIGSMIYFSLPKTKYMFMSKA